VVVADDSAVARRLLRAVLDRDVRFEIVGEAADGQQAVDVCGQERPDVVTLDLEMPVLDGRLALARLRRTYPATAVVVFTGHAVEEVVGELHAAGAAAVLSKQASPDQITTAIESAHRGPARAPAIGSTS
jgi:DNA-binding NarL/FixJ family response regulator